MAGSSPAMTISQGELRFGLMVVAVVLVLDQASKFVLVDLMRANPGGLEIAPFFNLVQVWNRGVSFGMLGGEWFGDNQRWILVVLSIAVSVLLGFWLRKAERGIDRLALGLVIGGALGNAIDRVVYGAVADFFDFHLGGWHWPAFNIADAAITCGAVGLILGAILPTRSRSLE
ncbi:signal peptidase II [Desertibaculum subflavum]|uniref:signal peptidase II n=1 Tax=Desertibaculum subflavum TaxID=2268458 RepID=UPI0034D36C69